METELTGSHRATYDAVSRHSPTASSDGLSSMSPISAKTSCWHGPDVFMRICRMNNDSDEKSSNTRVGLLLEQFHQLPSAGTTSADRLRRDQLLDEIQEAIGLSGKTVTERDII